LNKYDERYNFRKAKVNDLDRLMKFIREYWRADHILGNDREFFTYEHGDGENINFILCEDKKDHEIVGMQGFIPYSKNEDLLHICGVMTMVKKDVDIPMLGVELMTRFKDMMQYKTFCGLGTNPKTMVPIAKRFFHRYVGKMEHYYRLNSTINKFKIAKIVNRKMTEFASGDNNQVKMVEFKKFDEVKASLELNKSYRQLPYKEDWYIEKRYFDHPVYHYRAFGIMVDATAKAILLGRQVKHEGTKILRFVDFIGNVEDMTLAEKGIRNIIEEEGYEYADFILHGVPESIMNKIGFVRKREEDSNVIPNYFEPFVQSNVDIWFEASEEDLILFRADADGDRPNMR